MKRQGNLFPQIVAYQNLRLAWLKAIRGKRKSSGVLLFNRNVDANLNKIKARLQSENPGWGNYRSFIITDPKERIISAAPFPERVMHHAIMNILEPLFERKLIYHSYACRKGKGTHAAVIQAFHTELKYNDENMKYFLEFNISYDINSKKNLTFLVSEI